MNRRSFLRGASASVMASGMTPVFAQSLEKSLAPSDTVSVGVIGPGSRGQELMRKLLRTPGVGITAACDIYEPRFAEVDQLVGSAVPRYKDYRQLLERKDLDAIVVATPLYLHAEHVKAALNSGRAVYGEKSMGFTAEDSQSILQTVQQSGKIFQVGHQYRYAAWFQDAVSRARDLQIGRVTQVVAYWNRNNDWRRPVADPKDERLINWRLYKEYSGGLLTELGSHHIDLANWVFGEQPTDVMGTGSIAVYHDGREVDDNVQVVFGYSEGRRLTFTSMTSNSLVGEQIWIYGTNGSLQLTLQDATFYYEPRPVHPVSPQSEVMQHGVTTGASFRAGGEMPYRGKGTPLGSANGDDPTQLACQSFIECVREKKAPIADVHVGYRAAIAATYANRSIQSGCKETIPPAPAAG
ncbi:MAG TPA: Gfo/Idh/MocA family oxidoreductase [Acidisarcina sp.]|nr:Gfo/Idh/MocA family oxidoreductase [Acidisarcina sp.]